MNEAQWTRRSELQALRLECQDQWLTGTAAGYDLSDSNEKLRSVKDLAKFFFRLVEVFEPSVFIEAGAKEASASRRAAAHAPNARVVAFEANPFTHARFRDDNDFERTRVEYMHMALSESPGTVEFNVRLDGDGKPIADGKGSLKTRSDKGDLKKVEVEASSLDVFFEKELDEGSFALWIDVEGAHKAVLSGGARLLEKTSVLLIEVEDRASWDQEWLRPEVVDYLNERGLFPVARDFQSRYEYNLLFVRDSLRTVDRFRWNLARYLSETNNPKRKAAPPAAHSRQASRGIMDRVEPAIGRLLKRVSKR